MNTRWLPVAAGVLEIVAGITALAGALALGFSATVVANIPAAQAEGFPLSVVAGFLAVLSALVLLAGLLSVIGGIFALNRRRFGWALTGAIAATFCSPPFGVPAIILTVLGEAEIRATPATAN